MRISSLQSVLSTPEDSSLTPESPRSLSLRSSSLRLEGWEVRTEDRASQLISESLQPLSLNFIRKKTGKRNTGVNEYSYLSERLLDLEITKAVPCVKQVRNSAVYFDLEKKYKETIIAFI